ncbi:MAG: type 4a pilus biogenesis protein PilO [Mariprofundaceae bacterium]|nr:type 4a pilus biogenesis protein PilO [Mariprofundaceae bacterium]
MNLDALNLDGLRPVIPLPMASKLTALAGVFVLLCAAYYMLFWDELQQNIEQEKVQVENQRLALVKNQRLANDIPKKRKEYALLQKQLKVALNMLPKKSEIPDLLEGITWAGKDSGLAFSIFKPGKETVQSIYAEVPVSLSVSGTFRQFLTFLKRVGEMPRIVDIKDLQLSIGAGQVLKVQGKAVTYRFVDAKVKSKGPKR